MNVYVIKVLSYQVLSYWEVTVIAFLYFFANGNKAEMAHYLLTIQQLHS